jgi:hypothetical protein
MDKPYYVVTGIWRESRYREMINGFYSRREAMEESFCHKHTHSKILIVKIDDTPEAMADLLASFDTGAPIARAGGAQ